MAKERSITGYQCVCLHGKSNKRSGIGENCDCKRLSPKGIVARDAKPVSMKKIIVMW